MDIVFLVIGLLVGFFAGWLFNKSKSTQTADNTDALAAMHQQILTESNAKSSLFSENNLLRNEGVNLKAENKVLQEEILNLSKQLTAQKSDSENLQIRLTEHKAEITTLNERFTKEFENLANR
ncbi:MAG: hypothetical protein ACOYMA_22915, partial [Bacteroidia bacterium]